MFSVLCSSKYMTPPTALHIYKKPKIKYFCHTWSGATQSSLSSNNSAYAALWVVNCFPPYNPFSTDETLQASRYSIHGKCSDESSFLISISPTLIFPT